MFSPYPVPCPIVPKCTQLTHVEAVPPVIWEVPIYIWERQAGFHITLATILDLKKTAMWWPADLLSTKQLQLKVGVEFVNAWGLRVALCPPLFENIKCPGYELCEWLPLLIDS